MTLRSGKTSFFFFIYKLINRSFFILISLQRELFSFSGKIYDILPRKICFLYFLCKSRETLNAISDDRHSRNKSHKDDDLAKVLNNSSVIAESPNWLSKRSNSFLTRLTMSNLF